MPLVDADAAPGRSLTVSEVARRYRVGEDKVRTWIRRGDLRAINTADVACGKPRYVVPPEALDEFERRRSAASPPKPKRQKRSQEIDYFPEF